MSTFSTILCPIDFSDCSGVALEHAIALARRHSSEVVALHAVLPAWPPLEGSLRHAPSEVAEPGAREKAMERLEAFVANALRAAGSEARVRSMVVDGFPIDAILDAEKSLSADLLVLGTHGFGFAERLVLGSVTERVLRRATKPVLTVPRAACASPQKEFQTVLCGVDFGQPSLWALDLALGVAGGAGARLVLVHVIESLPEEDPAVFGHFNVPEFRQFLVADAQKRLESLVDEAARKETNPEFVVVSGKAYRQILRVAEERDADLLVLGIQGRGSIDLALFGSTANQLVRHARCPVLTVRKETPSPA